MFLQIQSPTLLECSLVFSHRQAAARLTNQEPFRTVTTSNMAFQEPQQDGAPRSMVKQGPEAHSETTEKSAADNVKIKSK